MRRHLRILRSTRSRLLGCLAHPNWYLLLGAPCPPRRKEELCDYPTPGLYPSRGLWSCIKRHRMVLTGGMQTVRVIGMALATRWSINPLRTITAIKAKDFWDPAKPS